MEQRKTKLAARDRTLEEEETNREKGKTAMENSEMKVGLGIGEKPDKVAATW